MVRTISMAKLSQISSHLYKTRKKTAGISVNLRHSVDDILISLLKIEPYLNFFIPTTENLIQANDNIQKRMKSGEVVLSEGDSDLWERALGTSLGDINTDYIPHYNIVQNLINYTLNSSFIHFGMLTSFFTKLILFHPPAGTNMRGYYWFVLNDRYVMLNKIRSEEKNLFWCLVELVTSCLENEECLEAFHDIYCQGFSDSSKEELLESMINLNNTIDNTGIDSSPCRVPSKREISCFESLPPADKLRRILVVFRFVCDILESDLVNRMKTNFFLTGEDGRAFLSVLLWQNIKDVGAMNAGVRTLIHVYKLMEASQLCLAYPIHKKLLMLLAEIVRRSDAAVKPVYPFFGNNAHDLANEISLKYIEALTERYSKEATLPIRTMKPNWLRLLVCCNLLSYITGKLCSPDLTHLYDILEHALHLIVQRQDGLFSKGRRCSDGYLKKRDLKGSSKLGSKRCHVDCRLLKRGERLKTSQVSNVNDLNDAGWGALHEAILKGHEGCVEDLLYHRGRKKPDVRLKGHRGLTPLMCAVAEGRPKICRLLLEHSGSELLEDVNDDGHTPVELCANSEVADLLKSFSKRKSNPVDGSFNFTSDDAKLVVDLCVHASVSYFITHRTRDVWERLKNDSTTGGNAESEEVEFNYLLYDADIRIRVPKLMTILQKLRDYKEIRICIEPLIRILSFTSSN